MITKQNNFVGFKYSSVFKKYLIFFSIYFILSQTRNYISKIIFKIELIPIIQPRKEGNN